MSKSAAVILIATLFFCSCKKDLFDCDDSSTLQQNLQKLADAYVDAGIPGIVILTDHPQHGGKLIVASGKASLENGTSLTKTHLFHSASVMKIYTAACIMKLQESSQLNTGNKISQYLPAVTINKIPNGGSATISQLMNHSSGIPDFTSQNSYITDLMNYFNGAAAPQDALEYIKNPSPQFTAGTKNSYSNSNYHLLALIVEQLTGSSFQNFITQQIINPLGLSNTFYKNEPGYSSPPGLPQYYIDWDDIGQLTNSSSVESKLIATTKGMNGMIASAEDYWKFAKALFRNNLLLTKPSVDFMKATSDFSGFQYGHGLEVSYSKKYPDRYGHKGGSQSGLYYYPQEDCFIVFLLNYSFNTGGSPIDKLANPSDEVRKNKTLLGEIEKCLF